MQTHSVTPGPGSLSAALLAASAGDTLTLSPGDYAEPMLVARKPVTIAALPGPAKPRILPQPGAQIGLWVQSSGVTLQGVEIVGGSVYCLAIEPTGAGAILEDCLFRDSLDHLLKLKPKADNVTIRRCEFTRTLPYTNVSPGVLNAIDCVDSDKTLVEDCYFHQIIGTGIVFKGSAIGSIARQNTISDCYMGILLGGITGPEFVLDPQDNPQMYDSVDCIAQGNIIQRAAIAGLASYGSLRPQFTGNNVSDCKEGLRLYPNETTVGGKTVQQPTTDAIVEGNTIVMPYRALRWAIYVGVLGKAGKLALMNNRYGQRGGMSPNFVDASETITPVLFEGTLQKWAQHTGQEQGSVDMVSGYVVPSPVPTGGIQ